MAFETIGSAYLELRPDLSRFRHEVREGVRESLREATRDAAKVALGAFAFTGVAEFIHEIGHAASATQATLAQVQQTAKNVTNATAEQQREIAEQVERNAARTGFAVRSVGEAYGRLLVATKDQGRAYADVQLAENIARGRHIELAQAATVLSRAEQGSTTSLSRLGIILPKVTTSQQALGEKIAQVRAQLAEHTRSTQEASAAGEKQTHVQRVLANTQADSLKHELSLLQARQAQAKTIDGLASRTSVLAALQQRFGGQTDAYTRTAAGATDRFKVAVEELQASIGQHYLPGLANVLTSLADYIAALQHSTRFQADLNEAEQDTARILGEIRDVAEEVGPVLFRVADAAEKFVGAVGAGPILAYIVAVRTAQALIARFAASEASAAEQAAAATAATNAQAAAVTRLSEAYAAEALAARSAATSTLLASRAGSATGAIALAGGARGAVAAEQAAVGASAAVGARGVLARGGARAGAAALGLVGLGGLSATAAAATGGIALLAGGLYYLSTRESEAHRRAKELEEGLGALGEAARAQHEATLAITATRQEVGRGRLETSEARLAIEEARQQLAVDRATHASRLQLAADAERVANAEQQWRDSNHRLQQALGESHRATVESRAATRDHEQALNDLTPRLEDATRSTASKYRADATAARGARDHALEVRLLSRATVEDERARRRAISVLDDYRKSIATSNPVLARNIGLVQTFVERTGRIPPRIVTNYLLEHGSADRGFRTLFDKLTAFARAHPTAVADLDTSRAFAALEALAAKADSVKAHLDAALGAAHDTPPGLEQLPDQFQAQADAQDRRRQANAQTKRDKAAAADVAAQKKRDALVATAQRADQAQADREAAAQAAKAASDEARQRRAELQQANRELAVARAAARADQIHPTPREIAAQTAAAVSQAKANLLGLANTLAGEVTATIDAMTAAATSAIQRQLDTEQAARRELQQARAVEDAQRAADAAARDASRLGADAPLQQSILQEQLVQAQEALAAAQKARPQPGQTANDRALTISQAQLAVVQAQRAIEDFPRQVEDAQRSVSDAQQQAVDAQAAIADQALQDQQARIQSEADTRKKAAAQSISDLADQFNRGIITAKTFNQRLAAELRKDGVDYKSAGALLGQAFADGFRASLATIAQQITALRSFITRGGGSGQVGQVERPGLTRAGLLEQRRAAVRQAQQQLADARRSLAQAAETTGGGGGGSTTSVGDRAPAGTVNTTGAGVSSSSYLAAVDAMVRGPHGRIGYAPGAQQLSQAQATAIAARALQITGHYSAGNLGALVGRLRQESGFNTGVVNLWDSNAAKGHPSFGLGQTIDSTFTSYAKPGYGDPSNPLDQVIASIRYMFAGYGHIVGPSGSGYSKEARAKRIRAALGLEGGAAVFTDVAPAKAAADKVVAELREVIAGAIGLRIDHLEIHSNASDPAEVAKVVITTLNKQTRKSRG